MTPGVVDAIAVDLLDDVSDGDDDLADGEAVPVFNWMTGRSRMFHEPPPDEEFLDHFQQDLMRICRRVSSKRRSRAMTRAFAKLDEVNLEEVFRDRASSISEGGVLGCCAASNGGGSIRDQVGAMKNTRMETLLVVAENSPQGMGGLIQEQGRERFAMFAQGHWITLLRQGHCHSTQSRVASTSQTGGQC